MNSRGYRPLDPADINWDPEKETPADREADTLALYCLGAAAIKGSDPASQQDRYNLLALAAQAAVRYEQLTGRSYRRFGYTIPRTIIDAARPLDID